MRSFIAVFSFAVLGLAACGPASEDAGSQPVADQSTMEAAVGRGRSGPIAKTEQGVVRGLVTAATRQFRGIPYAAAPVGDLRWRPPQPHARWSAPLDGTQFRGHCPQVASPFGLPSENEDCLYLNVYTPRNAHPQARLPVMVFFHGGVFLLGEGDGYDPTPLVARGDVVVVTTNYRLGELGFLAHPALTAESPDHASGNYGIMDQQAALRWVQRNIEFFGGDPARVTIFGESAGGVSVHTHLASPRSAGLFQRAIVESGAYALTNPTLAEAEGMGTSFATAVGCPDQSAACLRALPVAQILGHQRAAFQIGPNLDGHVLTQSIGQALASGEFNRVPIIEGTNHDEWRLFVAVIYDFAGSPLTADAYPGGIQATTGVPSAYVPLFEAQYPLSAYASPSLALSALGTDGLFACPARYVDQLVSQYVPTYAYEFNDVNAPALVPPASFPYGATHGSELLSLFDVFGVPRTFTADQQKLANTMIDFWTSFAATGQPSSDAAAWPLFENDAIESLVPPTPVVETGFAADHKCAFWDSLRQ